MGKTLTATESVPRPRCERPRGPHPSTSAGGGHTENRSFRFGLLVDTQLSNPKEPEGLSVDVRTWDSSVSVPGSPSRLLSTQREVTAGEELIRKKAHGAGGSLRVSQNSLVVQLASLRKRARGAAADERGRVTSPPPVLRRPTGRPALCLVTHALPCAHTRYIHKAPSRRGVRSSPSLSSSLLAGGAGNIEIRQGSKTEGPHGPANERRDRPRPHSLTIGTPVSTRPAVCLENSWPGKIRP